MMQKIIFALFFFILYSSASLAQNDSVPDVLRNKKGQRIIPQAGSIAGGIDLTPVLNYLGNFANNTQNNTYQGNPFLGSEQTLLIKYFLKENTALRFRLGYQNSTFYENYYVQDDIAIYKNPLSEKKVTDSRVSKNNSIGLALGYEKNRTKGRLRGIVGTEVLFAWSKASEKYFYGNRFSSLNTSPSSHDFGSNLVDDFRLRYKNFGNTYTTGLSIFAASEYFIMPNICIGAELNLSAVYSIESQVYTTEKYWNGASEEAITRLSSPGNSYLGVDMANPAIGLYLMMHF